LDKKEDNMNIGTFPGNKSIALLIDPDKVKGGSPDKLLESATKNQVDYILAGGSLTFNSIEPLITAIRKKCSIPVILFPGNLLQLSCEADAILLLSLISGRNPELLIGNHVIAAPFLRDVRSKIISTGYILINCGSRTSVEYMSQTESIPADKPEIVIATALAGEMLGFKMIYLEGGSGANSPVPAEIISAVRENINIPIAVGGGLRTSAQIEEAFKSGANLVVLGNGVEENPGLLNEACQLRNRLKS
jgi:phosphoglycerol geranylgeranyltransferase